MDWTYYSAGVNAITTRKATLIIPKVLPRLRGQVQAAYLFSHRSGVTTMLIPLK